MNRNSTFICILLVLSLSSLAVVAEKTIVVNGKILRLDDIDRITYDMSDGTVRQLIWKDNISSSSELIDGLRIPIFRDLDIENYIYRCDVSDSEWEEAYLTPVGYFFRSRYDAFFESEGNSTSLWCYESFDNLHWAAFTVDDKSLTVDFVSHNDGELYYNMVNDLPGKFKSEVIHMIGESVRTTELPIDIREIVYQGEEGDSLKGVVWHFISQFVGYEISEVETELAYLLETFPKILDIPYADSADQDTASKVSKQSKSTASKTKKKLFPSAIFGIYPITGDVRYVFDTCVGPISGAIRCSSSDFLENAEYGILLDTNPENLFDGKAEKTIMCRQEKLSLRFESDITYDLTPDVTYYYRTFCRLKGFDKDKYHFKYEYKDSNVGYGKIKTFTTYPDKQVPLKIEISSKYESFPSGLYHFYCGIVKKDVEYIVELSSFDGQASLVEWSDGKWNTNLNMLCYNHSIRTDNQICDGIYDIGGVILQNHQNSYWNDQEIGIRNNTFLLKGNEGRHCVVDILCTKTDYITYNYMFELSLETILKTDLILAKNFECFHYHDLHKDSIIDQSAQNLKIRPVP